MHTQIYVRTHRFTNMHTRVDTHTHTRHSHFALQHIDSVQRSLLYLLQFIVREVQSP